MATSTAPPASPSAAAAATNAARVGSRLTSGAGTFLTAAMLALPCSELHTKESLLLVSGFRVRNSDLTPS